jgi:hypothetical protein
MGMVTDDDVGLGVGAGEGDGDGDGETGDDELSFPQAIENIKTANTTVRRNDNMRFSSNEMSETGALMTPFVTERAHLHQISKAARIFLDEWNERRRGASNKSAPAFVRGADGFIGACGCRHR